MRFFALASMLGKIIEHVWLVIALLVLWWVLSLDSTSFFFPPLRAISEALLQDMGNGTLPRYMLFSLGNLALGMAVAIGLGIMLGIYFGQHDYLREIANPLMYFMRAIPASSIVPLVIIMFGLGSGPKVFIIAFACFWPILLNTIDGVRGVPTGLRDMQRAYCIPKLLGYRKVIFFAALPQIMVGIRIALGIGVVVMVISELFGSNAGVGFYIIDRSQVFAVPETWAGTLLVAAIGYGLSGLMLVVEKYALAWYFLQDPRQ